MIKNGCFLEIAAILFILTHAPERSLPHLNHRSQPRCLTAHLAPVADLVAWFRRVRVENFFTVALLEGFLNRVLRGDACTRAFDDAF